MTLLNDRFKNALVTGASSGLGRSFAKMLLDEGLEVWATSRDPDRLFTHPRLHPMRLDLSDTVGTELFAQRILAEAGELDLLINNAGYGAFFPFERFPREEISGQLNVLLSGPILLSREIYAHMKARGCGAIINVSSLASEFPIPCLSIYNSAKAGLSAFTRSLMLEAAGSGVVLIDLQPGDFRTAFNEKLSRDTSADLPESLRRTWEKIEKHMENSPEAERAARALLRLLRRPRSGTYRIGGFFQARIGPFLARFLPRRAVCSFLRCYYGLSRR